MQIKYTLTEEDLFHYYDYVLTRNGRLRPSYALFLGLLLALLGVLNLILVLLSRTSSPSISDIVLAILFIFRGMNSLRTYTRWGQKRLIQQNAVNSPSLFTPHTVTIDPEWLHIETVFSDLRVRWQAVRDVHSDAAYIFIITGSIVYTIARRNFSDLAASHRFLDTVNQYWQMAKVLPVSEAGQQNVWPPSPRIEG